MSRVTELEKALTTLFRKGTEVGYTETEIDEFLENIDYRALLQAVWNKAETVYAYRADGKNALSLDYRSSELFKQRATLLYPKGFEYLMFDEPKQKPRSLENRARLGIPPYGNGWPGIRVRWCTGQLKTHLITKEVNRLKGELGAIHYVGIAADEAWRCKDERYPLVEWGITEAQALQACYDRGFDFGGLYEIYHRASCWCCPFQRIDELRKLRKHHPELWEKLLELDRRALAQFGTGPLGQFKQNWSVERLDERFAKEDGQTA